MVHQLQPTSRTSSCHCIMLSLAAALLLSSCCISLVEAVPMFFLTSPNPKCVMVEVPSGTSMQVKYEVPDLQQRDPKDRSTRRQTILTIAQPWNNQYSTGKRQVKKTPASSTIIEKTSGSVLYKTEADGTIQACIRAQAATPQNPSRVSLLIVTGKDSAHYEHEAMEHHLSKVQVDLLKLHDKVEAVLNEADFAKQREQKFHQQSVSMHAASQYWPMVQICVLCLTGFTQAMHMVRFFKTKRLI